MSFRRSFYALVHFYAVFHKEKGTHVGTFFFGYEAIYSS